VPALRLILVALLVWGFLGSASAASSPRYHTVASGQRLGSIAKRYGVSIDALCTANGIERKQPLKIGQKLLVPSRNDSDGSITRRQYGPPERRQESSREEPSKGSAMLASTGGPSRPATHRVYSGQRLESIARRYQVTIEALCEANHIRRTSKLKPGQVLVIPGSLPEAKPSKVDERDKAPRASSKPVKKGYVDLSTYTARYRGTVFAKNGKVTQSSIASISGLFGATGSRPRVSPRLIALLAEVSAHFGGRPMRVVSGWRDHSYVDDSRHKHSQAVDFSIPGVPNTVLRDYLRRFRNCGVGYYPNSSFVHLDVRESAAYWVDYAGPGEAPRTTPRAAPKSAVAAASNGSGDIEEAGGDVDDRPTHPPPARPTRPAADVTSGASRTAPSGPAPAAAATPPAS
jgi:LysM repeat protein